MKLGEFIKQFSHNNIVRLVYDFEGGSEIVAEDWNTVSMDHEIVRQVGVFRHYIDNEVLGLTSILVKGQYPEAINIRIEKIDNQPKLKDLYGQQNNTTNGQ